MINEDLMTVKELHAGGKLHWRLIFRIVVLCIYSISFLGIASYHFFADDLHFFVATGVFAAGFLLGLFFISRMFGIYWDEKRGVIMTGKVDVFGFCMILFYIAIRFWINNILDFMLHPGVIKLSGLAFCLIAGIMIGRFLGTIRAVQQAHARTKHLTSL